MKKILIILLFTSIGHAQCNRSDPKANDNFTFSINTEPNAWIKDGFNIGWDFEHFNDKIYVNIGAYLFPNLNEVGYTQLHSAFGLNILRNELRFYSGVKAGFTIRQSAPFMVVGVEAGVEYYFTHHLGIGLESSLLNRSAESHIYHNSEWIYNGGIKLIYKWK